MSWLDINISELEEQVKRTESKNILFKPDIYDVIVRKIYLDKTKSGVSFINFVFDLGDGSLLRIEGWDVNRMFRNKDGNLKNSKGFYNNGVILLEIISKIILNKNAKNLNPPVKEYIEIFGEQREVGVLKDFENKKISVGIRHRIRYYEKDGEIKSTTKLEIVNFCKQDDNECKENLKKRIEKNPILEDKKPEINTTIKENEEIPF